MLTTCYIADHVTCHCRVLSYAQWNDTLYKHFTDNWRQSRFIFLIESLQWTGHFRSWYLVLIWKNNGSSWKWMSSSHFLIYFDKLCHFLCCPEIPDTVRKCPHEANFFSWTILFVITRHWVVVVYVCSTHVYLSYMDQSSAPAQIHAQLEMNM